MNSSHADKPRPHSSQLARQGGGVRKWKTAGIVELQTAFEAVRPSFVRRWIGKFIGRTWNRRESRRENRNRVMLAHAILGLSRATLVSAFGPPRTVAFDQILAGGERVSFWEAQTWYFPLPNKDLMAMAIGFSEGYASYVEFFGIVMIS
jgi:hypothetical protein